MAKNMTNEYWNKNREHVATKLINDWKIDKQVANNVCGTNL